MEKCAKRALLWGAVLPLVMTATPVWAEQPAEAKASSDRSGLGEIVVTARRTEENLQTTPVAVTALGAEQISRQQLVDVSALQYAAPSLTVAPATGDTSAANIAVRGQSQSDNLIAIDPAVGIYLDGVYVARSSGALFNLVDVQRVEVLRGPQGTLYGRNTTGGAINLVAKRPEADFGGSISGRVGNFGLREVTAVANVPLGESAGFRVAYQNSEHDGYARNAFLNRELNDDKTNFVRGIFTLAPEGTGFDLAVTGDYTDRRNSGQFTKPRTALPTAFAGATPVGGFASLVPVVCSGGPAAALCPLSRPGDSLQNYIRGDFYTSNGNVPNTFNEAQVGGFGATVTQDFGGFSARLISSWRFTRSDASRDLDGTPYRILEGTGHIDQEQRSNELQAFGSAFGKSVDWVLGIYQFTEDGFDNSTSINLWPLRTTRNDITAYGDNKSIAYYGQAIWKVSDKLRLTGGLRYTEDERLLRVSNVQVNGFTSAFVSCSFPTSVVDAGTQCTSTRKATFDYVSYLASADYQLTPNTFLYAKTSRASRAGGFNVRGVFGASLDPFQPEQVTDYEVGAKLDLFDKRLRLNAATYYSDYQDIQRTVITTAAGQLVAFVQNAAKAHITGAELEATFVPTDNLRLSTVIGVLEPKYDQFRDPFSGADRSNEPFPRTPKTTIGSAIDYTIPLSTGEIVAHADYAWRSEAFFNTSNFSRQESYGLLNAKLSYEANNLSVGLWGRNLTDQEYDALILDTTGTAIGLATGFAGNPRTYGVSLGYKF